MIYTYEKPESELLFLAQESSFLESDGGKGKGTEDLKNNKMSFVMPADYEEE